MEIWYVLKKDKKHYTPPTSSPPHTMSYKKTKIPVVDAKTGYNKAAKIYNQFHAWLASYDKGFFQRFLPREVAGKTILDIWSGDARLHTYFADKHVRSYIWFDCAESLLKKAPSRVEKIIGDIEELRPFTDHSIDLWLCFFVLVHIRDIHHFFSEAKRVIAHGWSLIVLHNFQRRSYIYELPNDTFKIIDYHWKPSDIEQEAAAQGFSYDIHALEEKGTPIGVLYNFTPSIH